MGGMAAFDIQQCKVQQDNLQKQINQLKSSNVSYAQKIKKLSQDNTNKEAQIKQLKQALQISAQDNKWCMTEGIATAYSPNDNESGIEAGSTPNTTSIGLHPGDGIIAVDPSKIPYKSKMIVVYPNGQVYKGIAGDTGSALRLSRGTHIDIYKDTYAETQQHGVQNVLIFWQIPKTTN